MAVGLRREPQPISRRAELPRPALRPLRDGHGVQVCCPVLGYSLAGSTLAAGILTDDDEPITNEAYAWNLATGVRTKITLPSGDTYLSAAPGGILYTTGTAVLRIKPFAGAARTLVKPFATAVHLAILSAAVDSKGVVVSDNVGRVAWVPFASPHTITALPNPFGSSTNIVCEQVNGSYAACASAYYDDDTNAFEPYIPMLEPLDGEPPTVDSTSSCSSPSKLAVAGSTLLWTCLIVPEPNAHATLYSLANGATTSQAYAAPLWYPLVSAYGGGVVDGSPTQRSLLSVSSNVDVTTLVGAKRSPATLDAFRLTPTSVIYSDDQRLATRAGQLESVFTRRLAARSGSVHAGAPTLLGGSAKNVTGNLLARTSVLSVYATADPHPHDDALQTATLHVVYHGKTHTVPDAIGWGAIQAAGDRVLFQREVPPPGVWNTSIYDASTGKVKPAPHVPAAVGYNAIALSGDHLVYATPHGAIYRVSLSTGKQVRISSALPHDAGVEFDVYAHGHWVGWHAVPTADELAKPLNVIRNVKTMAAPIRLRHTLYSLTPAGAILSSTQATFHSEWAEAGLVLHSVGFWLRTYQGQVSRLLPTAGYRNGPEIAGHLLAWGSPSGVLRVKALRTR